MTARLYGPARLDESPSTIRYTVCAAGAVYIKVSGAPLAPLSTPMGHAFTASAQAWGQ